MDCPETPRVQLMDDGLDEESHEQEELSEGQMEENEEA
jgi:hypothetical protein